jgi:DNA-binding XRE family transcriptional regulator
MNRFPGIENPTSRDRLGLELARQQLNLIFGMRDIRRRRGLTVEQVAVDMDTTTHRVWQIETEGGNPTMSELRRYAKAVGAIFRSEVTAWEDEPT